MSHQQPSSANIADSTSLVAQMRPVLVKYFRRKTGSAADAEDLAQEVMVRALTHAAWKTQAEAKGYIFRIAINCWRDRRRRQRTHGVTVVWNDETAGECGSENSPECVLIRQEELNQLVQALRELNPRTRTVLMLLKLEQMKIATVADTLGISPRAVSKHLAKAMAKLALMRGPKEFS